MFVNFIDFIIIALISRWTIDHQSFFYFRFQIIWFDFRSIDSIWALGLAHEVLWWRISTIYHHRLILELPHQHMFRSFQNHTQTILPYPVWTRPKRIAPFLKSDQPRSRSESRCADRSELGAPIYAVQNLTSFYRCQLTWYPLLRWD